ncbi:MAG: class I mannose-6-phosphate isomerase [Bacteroidaceae bacterium]|nr:class I mannose-6-phosphate isomerase [Bacteroidaceae bacterium]
MKPYKFKPYLKETIWGGEKIAAFKGIATDLTNIGESWEISGVPGHESVTAPRGLSEDNDLGMTLPQLIDHYKGTLVGNTAYEKYGTNFPLLIKFIDSRQDLSVQVHPNDQLAQQRHGCAGKTEMWYVMHAAPHAKIHAGLNQAITPQDYERLVRNNTFMDVVATHQSHEGDVFFLPAGRVHSIGAGNFLVEIQQTSDITYRIYDFDRRDANGHPRELHVEQAKNAIDYTVSSDYRTHYETTNPNTKLVECPYFKVHRLVVEGTAEVDYQTNSFVIVICLTGEAHINGIKAHQGETLLVPACDNILHITGNATFLCASLNDK